MNKKQPEDSVVLSKGAYKSLSSKAKANVVNAVEIRKETAEKILNETMHIPVIEGKFVKVDDLIDKLKEIATREGVEIKEL